MSADAQTARRKQGVWLPLARFALAFVIFSLAAIPTYAPVWEAGAERVVPAVIRGPAWKPFVEADVNFEAWLVARHAQTLVHDPLRMFDTEHCAPQEKSLTLGVPMITLGLLAVPGYLATGDPILTYNLALVMLSLVGAAAMYLLVVEWTGITAAGIVAGLLFGFSHIRLAHLAHPAEWDVTWTVFAILFSQRLFANGRWRDALGLALAISLQVWATFYGLLASAFLGLPYAAWLLGRYRLRSVRASQLVFVAVAMLLAGWLLFAPYLEARASAPILQRAVVDLSFSKWKPSPSEGLLLDLDPPLGWSWLNPTPATPVGWLLIVLATSALVLGRKRVFGRSGHDPRRILTAAALFLAVVATGSQVNEIVQLLVPDLELPNLYTLLAGVIPGLDAVRVIGRLNAGVILVGCVLAGLGAAAIVRAVPRYSMPVAVVLVLAALVDVTRPAAIGLGRPYTWRTPLVAARNEVIEFFAVLDQLGNSGPILDVPFDNNQAFSLSRSPRRILRTFYHRRRTSACFGSYVDTAARNRLRELIDRLPDPVAAGQLREMGFTTVVVDGPRFAAGLEKKIRLAEPSRAGGLRFLYSSGGMAAYTLAGPSEVTNPSTFN